MKEKESVGKLPLYEQEGSPISNDVNTHKYLDLIK